MGTRGAYRHDLAGVVSHIASLDRSDSLGNRCVVVACNLGLVTAWLLLAMSYYGSLAVIGAAGGA